MVEDPLALLLRALDLLPVLAHAPGGLRLDVAEDVRVTADQLRVHEPRDVAEISVSTLLEQQRQEVDLEQQVTELVEKLLVVSRECSIRNLVGFFHGVRHDRPRGLLAVPRTVTSQLPGQLLQIEERLGEAAHARG